MGFLSSGGKGNSRAQTSSSTTTNTESTTINTVDNRAVQGDNATVGGNVTVNSGEASSVNVQQTDLGAIGAGLDIALESLGSIQSATSGAFGLVGDLTKKVLDASQSNTSRVLASNDSTISSAYSLANQARQSETSGAINNLTKYLLWIALAGIAAFVLVRQK
jgi:hypothetical protein